MLYSLLFYILFSSKTEVTNVFEPLGALDSNNLQFISLRLTPAYTDTVFTHDSM